MAKKLKIAIACGGTGGHIFPGLATGMELLARGHEVTLWMAGKDVESDAVKGWQGKIITIPAEGFQFGFSIRSLKTIGLLISAYRRALPLMRQDKPDILLAMGSYASFGPVIAAKKLNIPYVMHEANLVPGRAVSFLSRWAAVVATSFEKSRYYLKKAPIELTGMPLLRSLQDAALAPRESCELELPLRLLVMGGSRGAQVLNEVVPQALCAAKEQGAALQVVHIAGLQDAQKVEALYKASGVEAEVYQFVHQMEKVYARVDMSICRSGAASCAELAIFGVPALLVPYPYAVRNHQMSNARALQDSGAADVVAQEDLSVSWLRDYILSILEQPDRRKRMESEMLKRAERNGSGRLADLLERVSGERG